MSIYSYKNPPKGFYIYAHLREDFTPYYIGKGKGYRAWDTSGRSLRLPTDQSKRIVIIQDSLSEVGAFILERYYIRWFGRKDLGTGILRNKTDGGEGSCGMRNPMKGKNLPEEWKAKLRKPKTMTEKRRAHIASRVGIPPYNKGLSKYRYHSPDGRTFDTIRQAADAYGFKSVGSIRQKCDQPESGWTRTLTDYLDA